MSKEVGCCEVSFGGLYSLKGIAGFITKAVNSNYCYYMENNIGFLHGYGLIKQGFKSRFGWRPWEPL